MLSLSNATQLQRIANNPPDNGGDCPATRHDEKALALPARVFLEPPARADTLWTKEQFIALVMHMMNDNPINHFLTVWRGDDGKPGYAKADSHRRASEHAKWTYDTITGKARRTTSMGVYSKNVDNESTWAALDFDAHEGGHEMAKDRAIKAFSLLLTYRDRYVILSASGRGYHVFVFAHDLKPVREWTALLKDVAGSIPVPIQDGQCELFPAEGTEKQRTGRAIRIPGSYNPNTDSCELIIAETIRPLLDQLTEEVFPSTHTRASAAPRDLVRDREVNNSSYGTKRLYLLDQSPRKEVGQNRKQNRFLSPTTPRLIEATIGKHPILAKGTRHKVLATLTGDLIHKFGFTLSCDIVQAHWATYVKNLTTEYPEHFREFCAIWNSLLKEIVGNFSAKERAIYDKLNTTPQQEVFVLLHSFAYLAENEPFPIAQNSLADRLGQTQQGASYIIKVLIALEAITPTEKARINRRAARYRWLPAYAVNNGETNLISSPSGSDALSASLLNGAQNDMPQLPQVAGAFDAK
jgi:hypothetical protein